MRDAILPPDDLKRAIATIVGEAPVSFVQLTRSLPQLRGKEDLAVTPGCILWRGLSEAGAGALRNLHAEGAIFFWLCSPTIYTVTGNAPFLGLMSGSRRANENAWLPTLLSNRPPTIDESRKAAREYVAEIRRYSIPAI